MDESKPQEVVRFILNKLQDRSVSRRMIMKLYYLAELRSLNRRGIRFTDVHYKNYKAGPWSPGVEEAIQSIPEMMEEPFTTHDGKHGSSYSLAVQPKSYDLDASEIKTLEEVTERWGRAPPDRMVSCSKENPPYTWSEYNKPIDFEGYAHMCKQMREDAELKKKIYNRLNDIENGKYTEITDPKEILTI